MNVELACGCTSHDLERLSDAELIALCDAVGSVLGEEILKQGQREDAVASTLARDLTVTYELDLDDAMNRVISDIPESDFDVSRMPEVLEQVSQHLETPQQLGMGDQIVGALATLMLISRRLGRKAISGTGRSVRGVSADLTQHDLAVADSLGNVQLYWIGDLWNKHLSARINATVAREALSRGLGRADVGDIMRGVVNGSFPGARVPKTFQGSVRQYFEVLSGSVRTHGSSLGAIHSMSDAGVEQYEFSAVMDQRTSEICQYMHGRRFTVASAMSLESRMLRTSDPDEFKEVAGWKSLKQIERIAGGGSADDQSRLLAASGVQLPPLHGLCRSIVIPV